MRYKIKETRKANSIMRFIWVLKLYDNKKAFNDYMKRKEFVWK